MKTIKTVAVAAVLVALATLFIWQRVQINNLAAESASLRQQLAQAESEGNKPVVKPGAGSVDVLPSPELLRLRGEVGMLRRQLAEAKVAQSKKVAAKTLRAQEI